MNAALRACREHFLLAAGISALVNILYLSPTIYMMQVYDRVVPTEGVGTLLWLTLIVTLALGTLTALDAIRSRVLTRSGLRLEKLLARRLLQRLLSARVSGNYGGASQTMRDFDVLRQALSGPAATVICDIPWTPIYIFVAFLIHPLLALLIVAGGGVLVLIAIKQEQATRSASREAQTALNTAYAAQERIAARADTVRALGMRRAMINRQLNQRARGLSLAAQAQIGTGRYASAAKFTRLLLQSLALGLAALLAVEHKVSAGSIIAASVLLARGIQPVEQLVAAWPIITQARGAYRTIVDLVGNEEIADPARTRLPPLTGALDCQSISLRAGAEGAWLLRDISFAIPEGIVLGMVGSSGSGKTSLARVIAGAVPPDAGMLRFDGANAMDWEPEELASYIGYLPQDYALLPGTVAENIARFAADVGVASDILDEQVISAAKEAGAHQMILSLPKGYDTLLDAAGSGLSAGQRQRIALSRALYGSPAIIILDEPESALDAEGEAALHAMIRAKRQQGRTVLIVSHRNSVISLADKLIVLKGGSVVAFGTTAEVLGRREVAAPSSSVVDLKGAV